jgi:hypothetical protein
MTAALVLPPQTTPSAPPLLTAVPPDSTAWTGLAHCKHSKAAPPLEFRQEVDAIPTFVKLSKFDPDLNAPERW